MIFGKANFQKIISGNDDTLCLKSKSTLAIIFGKANSRKIVPGFIQIC